jgi:hypothetical protein
MRVSQKISLEDYDNYTRSYIPNKIPEWFNKDVRRRLGDSIYDFSFIPAKLRKSVHKKKNRDRDLSGKYALLSDHFYYFGDKPVQLPDYLLAIVKQGQGHRSHSNNMYIDRFLTWLNSLGLKPNHLYGKPQKRIFKEGFIGEC